MSICHEVNAPLVGISPLDPIYRSVSTVLWSAVWNYWFSVQHSAHLLDACWLPVSRETFG